MELIATSGQLLRHLGYHDPDLAPYFAGVFPSDRLPARPVEDGHRGYIVNIDHTINRAIIGSPCGRTMGDVRSWTVLPFR